jgi:type II secretion system protein G
MKRNNTKGFTLIELLVVIAIIGLLSTLAVVALNTARTKSRDAKRISDIKQIQTALELYYADASGYPADPTGGDKLGTGNGKALCTGGWKSACGATDTVYMGQVPPDPTGSGTKVYTYTQGGSGSTYSITFELEGTVGTLSGASTADPNGMQ